VFYKNIFEKFDLIFFYLGLLANIGCLKKIFWRFWPLSSFSSFLAKFLYFLQNYLAPGNLSNLSFCRTLLAFSEQSGVQQWNMLQRLSFLNLNKKINSCWYWQKILMESYKYWKNMENIALSKKYWKYWWIPTLLLSYKKKLCK